MLSFTKTRARTSAGPQSRNLSIVGSKKNFLNMKVHPRTALRLCTGRAAHRESRGIALLFLDNGTRRGSGAASRPGRSLHRKRAGTHCTEAWRGAKGQSGLVRKASPPNGIRSPDRPARSQSLHRLRYVGSNSYFRHCDHKNTIHENISRIIL